MLLKWLVAAVVLFGGFLALLYVAHTNFWVQSTSTVVMGFPSARNPSNSLLFSLSEKDTHGLCGRRLCIRLVG
jgi:hypothetical protein